MRLVLSVATLLLEVVALSVLLVGVEALGMLLQQRGAGLILQQHSSDIMPGGSLGDAWSDCSK